MKTLTVDDLPSPPSGRTGWPWTEGTLPDARDLPGAGLPSFSIVTPSYNQGRYLEETVRSVLLQGYPDLDYWIFDGGSTDDSVEIIRKYEPWLAGWVSERDAGQSDAINKGFMRSAGEVFGWLCSDDVLTAGALHAAARALKQPPGFDVVAGSCFCLHENDPRKNEVLYCDTECFDRLPHIAVIWQPSCFFRRSLVRRTELLRRDLHYCMDRELWAYFHAQRARWNWSRETLSIYRFTGENKSVTGKRRIIGELDVIYRHYIRERIPLTFWVHKIWLPLVRQNLHHPATIVRSVCRLLTRILSLNLWAFYTKDRVRVLQKEYFRYGVR